MRACQLLGVRNVSFLPGIDGRLHTQPQLVEPVLQALTSMEYRSVFCPWPYDAHTDHVATYTLLYEAMKRYPRNIDIWLYEVWSPLKHNICISDRCNDRREAGSLSSAHESQAAILNYADAFHGRSSAVSKSFLSAGAHFAEAFFNCDRAALLNHDNVPWPKP